MILDDDFERKVEAELARTAEWNRETLEAEITRLRQLLSEAEKREAEAKRIAVNAEAYGYGHGVAAAVDIAEAEYKRHCTGSGFDSQPARSTAHRILEALKALQSEER